MTPQSRLAARAACRQVDALVRADDAASAAGRVIRTLLRDLVRALPERPGTDPFTVRQIARHHLHRLRPALELTVYHALRDTAVWGRRTAAQALTRETPLPHLLATVARRRGQPVTEAVLLGQDASGNFAWADRFPTEAEPGSPEKIDVFGRRAWAGLPLFHALDPTRPPAPVSDAEARRLILDILFPPLSQPETARIVLTPTAGTSWVDRIRGLTSLAEPETLAGIITAGYAAGRTRQQLVQDILPAVQGVESSARRIARTEGLRVAHETQMQTHASLGELVIAYQIHATLDEHTRPEHAARSGTVYYRDPKPGQLGYDQMPRPPLEADGTPAPNCRCWLSPILRSPKAAYSDPSYEPTLAAAVLPDPVTYSAWWNATSERKRRLAVGTRRYDAAQAAAGERPAWADFLAPDGRLLTTPEIRAETAGQRVARVEAVRKLLVEREAALRRVRRYGYLEG